MHVGLECLMVANDFTDRYAYINNLVNCDINFKSRFRTRPHYKFKSTSNTKSRSRRDINIDWLCWHQELAIYYYDVQLYM